MAQTLEWSELDAGSDLLAALPPAARGSARLLSLPRSSQVFSKGDRPVAMYCVVSGEVRLVRRSHAGGEVVLQRARKGFVAEASLDQTAYHCDAIAVEDSRVLAISRKAFADALADKPFRQRWIGHLARELRRVRTHAERLSLKTARERIIHYIETEGSSGRVELDQSKKNWATELGLTHEALYRSLAEMERRNELTIDGTRLNLCMDAVSDKGARS
jgi:CRP-like cAMP-binding protein